VRSAEGGGEIDAVTSDLSDATGIARMVERIDSWLGGLDMLIACAGVGSGPLMEMAESGLALCDRKQSGATSRAPRARSRGFARRVSMTD
jgi:NAD(P)-dependent dehydrogenase (short-subunit alcohol dehydrogenase family)